ncbi:Uncharacterised protein [Cedecea neteri]|uniref:Uncharacterized protein n=1 Tax=Cedecea neteri TaxID=158822 RepID=A0A2X2T5Y5_9ENTR|nr:Uncharacterised protein [Cedecea neteri]
MPICTATAKGTATPTATSGFTPVVMAKVVPTMVPIIDVRRLRASERSKAHPHQFQGAAGENTGVQIAKNKANQRAKDDGAVHMGQAVEHIQTGDKSQQAQG